MKIRDFILKLQELPVPQKKIIAFVVVAITAAIMGFFWVRSVQKSLERIDISNTIEELKTINK